MRKTAKRMVLMSKLLSLCFFGRDENKPAGMPPPDTHGDVLGRPGCIHRAYPHRLEEQTVCGPGGGVPPNARGLDMPLVCLAVLSL